MRALICGVSGQDGAYLAKFLLEKGYEVIGGSRDVSTSTFLNLDKLKIKNQIHTTSIALNDFRSILQILVKYKPDEVYNLSAQSSVGQSFEQPLETIESIVLGTLNLLEAIRFLNQEIRFYNASSGECYGDTNGVRANEDTPFSPRSPYAVAKVAAHNIIDNYRESYKLFACNGILFNHESELRHEKFVTQKIVQAAYRISIGKQEELEIGNIEIERDWGWAPEYVEAMWRILNQDKPENFIIATGETVKLEYFIEKTFEYFELDYKNYIRVNKNFIRATDIRIKSANPEKAKKILNWEAKVKVESVIEKMCKAATQN
jgi:GDPmannose 4,6-dehydratase